MDETKRTGDWGPDERVTYLHLGGQCPGYLYMERGARDAAGLLGMEFETHDVQAEPDLARVHNMFFPGLIAIGDRFRLVYPGTGEQIAESYRLRGPLPGSMDYRRLPEAPVDHVTPLSPDRTRELAAACVRNPEAAGIEAKRGWLESVKGPVAGYVGRVGADVVAAVELVPEPDIPYPIPSVDENGLFITCLYGRRGPVDYRRGLMERVLVNLGRRGVKRVSAVSGTDTPYPNGPLSLFTSLGFRPGPGLGSALLRHRWERICLVTRDLASS